jgi:hypothetical protein
MQAREVGDRRPGQVTAREPSQDVQPRESIPHLLRKHLADGRSEVRIGRVEQSGYLLFQLVRRLGWRRDRLEQEAPRAPVREHPALGVLDRHLGEPQRPPGLDELASRYEPLALDGRRSQVAHRQLRRGEDLPGRKGRGDRRAERGVREERERAGGERTCGCLPPR